MYKLRVYIYLSRVPKLWRHKSYGFKSLVKLEGWQINFKITLGTRVCKKSCSTSNLAGMGALFDKFYEFGAWNWNHDTICSWAQEVKKSNKSKKSGSSVIKVASYTLVQYHLLVHFNSLGVHASSAFCLWFRKSSRILTNNDRLYFETEKWFQSFLDHEQYLYWKSFF